jgi:O-antigen/teichoic acid export membrane protein
LKKDIAISLLKDSWPLILSGVVISVYMKIDQVMIKEMMNNEAVGQYSAALRLSEVWYFIPMVIANSLFPAIINAKNQSEKLYYDRLQKLYDFMTWMAIFIALPMTFLSDWLINLLFGEEYHQAGNVLMIHIWASVFVFLGVASSKWFISENLQKYSFYRTLTGAIINILLNYIMIPLYGILGAAMATLISQSIASYFFNITNKKLRYTFLLQTNAILLPLRKLGVKFGK